MILLVTLLLLVAVLAFVGYPLVRTSSPTANRAVPLEGQQGQLLAEREHALAALKDLEFEHSIGNLSAEDYASLRAAQRHKAVAILSELDRLGETSAASTADAPSFTDHLALDTRLEDEIAQARRRIEDERAVAGTVTLRCPTCGMPHEAAARYCSACGGDMGHAAAPPAEIVTCPTCGARRLARDRFCADCGAALDVEARDENG